VGGLGKGTGKTEGETDGDIKNCASGTLTDATKRQKKVDDIPKGKGTRWVEKMSWN